MKALLLWILFWIVAAFLAAGWLRTKLAPRTTKLAYVFIAYILVIGVFSHLYYYAYSRDHSNFVFASEVLRTRKNDILAEKKEQLEHLKVKLAAVNQLYDDLEQKQVHIVVDPRNDQWVTLETNDYKYEFDIGMWGDRKEEILIQVSTLEMFDKKGTSFGTDQVRLQGPSLSQQKTLSAKEWERLTNMYFPPRTPEMYQEMLLGLRSKLEGSMSNLSFEIGEGEDRVEYWEYIDFFYFSTTTQTTIGFGDILPNRTLVRGLITTQVLLGLLLLGIVINIFASEQTKVEPNNN